MMDRGETIDFYHSLQLRVEQESPKMRGKVTRMMNKKMNAGKKPANITPKRGGKRASKKEGRG